MLQLLFILPLILIILLSKVTHNFFFSPSGIFASVWIFLMLLQVIMAPNFYFYWQTGFFICLFIYVFTAGELIGQRISKNPVFHSENVILDFTESELEKKRINFKRLCILVSLMSLCGAFLYLYYFIVFFGSFNEFLIGGTVLRDALYAGEINVPFFVGVLGLLGYTAVNLCLVYFVKYGFKWFMVIPFIAILMFSLTQAGRAGIVIIALQTFAAFFFRLIFKKVKFAEFSLLKPFLFFLTIFYFVFYLIEAFRSKGIDALDALSSGDRENSILNNYLFGGISGLSTYLQTIYANVSEFTYGRYSFSSLYDLLGIAKAEPGVYDQYLRISDKLTGNVYTIFRPLLDDFGIFGFVFVAFVLGIFSFFAFTKTLKGNLFFTSFILSIYTYILFSPIAPLTQFNSFLLSLFFAPFAIKVVYGKFQSIT